MLETNNDLTLLWGAEAIGRAIGISRRRAFYLLESRIIPGKKVGGRWVASREKLIHAILSEEVDE